MKLNQSQKGLAIVEAAIILPVFLLLMFGIMEFGIVLYEKAVIRNANREAARSGIALRSPKLTKADIEGVAIRYCQTNLIGYKAANLTVTATQSAPPDFGTQLRVDIVYRYNNMVLGSLLGLFPGNPFPNPLPLPATTTMNNE